VRDPPRTGKGHLREGSVKKEIRRS
jgi:hypothetical protein